MPESDAESARSNQTIHCRVCNYPIRPGQARTPLQDGGILHEHCGIRTEGDTEDWLFYCYECDYATGRFDVIQGCPSCGSAKTSIVPPAGHTWGHGKSQIVRVCPDCYEPFENRDEWKEHECR